MSPWGNSLGSFTKWGINGELARQALLLTVAERLGGAPNATLEATATNTLALLLGRNSFGRSFVTKLGRHPAAHPHHRPSIVYSDAWPGYLVGGPNGGARAPRPARATAAIVPVELELFSCRGARCCSPSLTC